MLRNFFKVWKPADKPEPGASPVGIFNSPSLSPTISVLLFALVAWTFLPSLHNGFVSYDDARYIAANKHVTEGLNWENVRWAFTTTAVSNWHPVTWLAHAGLFLVRPAPLGTSFDERAAARGKQRLAVSFSAAGERGGGCKPLRRRRLRSSSAAGRIRRVGGGTEGCAECVFWTAGADFLCAAL